jgi:HTH-type transcriptional regulator / antitoxin HigA
MKKINARALAAAWKRTAAVLGMPLGRIRSTEDFERAVAVLDQLLETSRGDSGYDLGDLVSLLGALIEDYESATLAEAAASPAEVLRLLMESNGLAQADLAQELGGQSVVSAILNGRRAINARQAGALAERFNMSAAVFIETPRSAGTPGARHRATSVRAPAQAARLQSPRKPTRRPRTAA